MTQTRRDFLRSSLLTAGAVGGALLVGRFAGISAADAKPAAPHHYPVTHTEAEWKKLLTPTQYNVLRESGTERAFSGQYEAPGAGTMVCAACANPLFNTATEFDSGTGWPSFWQPLTKTSVLEDTDTSLGMDRTEVKCARCGSHLGHVFDDGPKPTGLRYCMNAVAMKFVKKA